MRTAALLLLALAGGCSKGPGWEVQPQPPLSAATAIGFRALDAEGQPLCNRWVSVTHGEAWLGGVGADSGTGLPQTYEHPAVGNRSNPIYDARNTHPLPVEPGRYEAVAINRTDPTNRAVSEPFDLVWGQHFDLVEVAWND